MNFTIKRIYITNQFCISELQVHSVYFNKERVPSLHNGGFHPLTHPHGQAPVILSQLLM